MRLYSIIQWHHFAYMMISLALLGFGASGALLTILQRPLLQRFAASYIINIALFGISTVGCFLLAQRLPFNAEEVLWDPRQYLWLTATYLLLAVPFFFAANAIASSINFSAGDNWLTRPHSRASWGVTRLLKRIISSALALPTMRGNR